MVTENVTTGAGTCVYEGTRERKKSQVAEQGCCRARAEEPTVLGEPAAKAGWGSANPQGLRGQGASCQHTELRVRASEAGAGIPPASPWLVSHTS